MTHKIEVLRGHCDAVGRDIAEIEFTLGRQGHDPRHRGRGRPRLEGRDGAQPDADSPTSRRRHVLERHPEQIADRLRPYVELGFRTVISEQPAPYDVETLERFIGEVVPLLAG